MPSSITIGRIVGRYRCHRCYVLDSIADSNPIVVEMCKPSKNNVVDEVGLVIPLVVSSNAIAEDRVRPECCKGRRRG